MRIALASKAGARSIVPDLDAKLVSGKKIPILITCGGKDTGNPCDSAVAAYEKLKAGGYPAKVVEYPVSFPGFARQPSAPVRLSHLLHRPSR